MKNKDEEMDWKNVNSILFSPKSGSQSLVNKVKHLSPDMLGKIKLFIPAKSGEKQNPIRNHPNNL
jgi:hypothetical protein